MNPNQQETLQTWDQLADIYWDTFSPIRIYDESYDAFLQHLPKLEKPAVLDLCCGPGTISSYLVRRNPCLHITLSDASPNMVSKALEMLPEAIGVVLRADEIYTLKPRFDGIVFGFGIPYLSADENLKCLTDCFHLLHPGGLLYLSFVQGDKTDSGMKKGSTGQRTLFYYYQTYEVLSWCLTVGFSLLDTRKILYETQHQNPEEHVIVLCRKADTKIGQ